MKCGIQKMRSMMINPNKSDRKVWLNYLAKIATKNDAKTLLRINRRALNKALPQGEDQTVREYNDTLNEYAADGPYFSKNVIEFVSRLDQHVGPAENRKGFIKWVADALERDVGVDRPQRERQRIIDELGNLDADETKIDQISFIKDWFLSMNWPDINAYFIEDLSFTAAYEAARDWHDQESCQIEESVEGKEKVKQVEHRFGNGYKIVYEPTSDVDPIARRKLGSDLRICLQSGHYRDNRSGKIYSLRGPGNPGKAHVCIRKHDNTVVEIKAKNNQKVWKVSHAMMIDDWFKKINPQFSGSGTSDYNAFPPYNFTSAMKSYKEGKENFYRRGHYKGYRDKFIPFIEKDLEHIFSGQVGDRSHDSGYLLNLMLTNRVHYTYMGEFLKYIGEIAVNFPHLYFTEKLYRTYSSMKKRLLRVAAKELILLNIEGFYRILNDPEYEDIKNILKEFLPEALSQGVAAAKLRIHAPGGNVDSARLSRLVSDISENPKEAAGLLVQKEWPAHPALGRSWVDDLTFAERDSHGLLTPEAIRLHHKLRSAVVNLAEISLGADVEDEDELTYLTYQSLVDAGIGLWEGREPWHAELEDLAREDDIVANLVHNLEMEISKGKKADKDLSWASAFSEPSLAGLTEAVNIIKNMYSIDSQDLGFTSKQTGEYRGREFEQNPGGSPSQGHRQRADGSIFAKINSGEWAFSIESLANTAQEAMDELPRPSSGSYDSSEVYKRKVINWQHNKQLASRHDPNSQKNYRKRQGASASEATSDSLDLFNKTGDNLGFAASKYETEILDILLRTLTFNKGLKQENPEAFKEIIRGLTAHGGPWAHNNRSRVKEFILKHRLYRLDDSLYAMIKDSLGDMGLSTPRSQELNLGLASPSREAFESRGFGTEADENGEIIDAAGRFNVNIDIGHKIWLSGKAIFGELAAYDSLGASSSGEIKPEGLVISSGISDRAGEPLHPYAMIKKFFKLNLHNSKEFRPYLENIARRFTQVILKEAKIDLDRYSEYRIPYTLKKLLKSSYISAQAKEDLIGMIMSHNTGRYDYYGQTSAARFLLDPSMRWMRNLPESKRIIKYALQEAVYSEAGLRQPPELEHTVWYNNDSNINLNDLTRIYKKYNELLSAQERDLLLIKIKKYFSESYLDSNSNLSDRDRKKALRLIPSLKEDPKIELYMLMRTAQNISPHLRDNIKPLMEDIARLFRIISKSSLAKNILKARHRLSTIVETKKVIMPPKLYAGVAGAALKEAFESFGIEGAMGAVYGMGVTHPKEHYLLPKEFADPESVELILWNMYDYAKQIEQLVELFHSKVPGFWEELKNSYKDSYNRRPAFVNTTSAFNIISTFFKTGMHKIFKNEALDIQHVLQTAYSMELAESQLAHWKMFEGSSFASLILKQAYEGSGAYAEYDLYDKDEEFLNILKKEIEGIWNNHITVMKGGDLEGEDVEEKFTSLIYAAVSFITGFMSWSIKNLPEEFGPEVDSYIDLYSVHGDTLMDEEEAEAHFAGDEPEVIKTKALRAFEDELPVMKPSFEGTSRAIHVGGRIIYVDGVDDEYFIRGYNLRGSLEAEHYPLSSNPVAYEQSEVDVQTVKNYNRGLAHTPEDIVDFRDQEDLVFKEDPKHTYDERLQRDLGGVEWSFEENEDMIQDNEGDVSLEEEAPWTAEDQFWADKYKDRYADVDEIYDDPEEAPEDSQIKTWGRRVVDIPSNLANKEDVDMEDNIKRKAWLKRMSRLTKLATRRKNIKINLPPYFKTWLRDRLIAQGEIDFRMEERMQFSLTMKYLGELPESAQRAILNDFQNMRGSKIEISTPEENIEVDIADEPARRNRRGSIKDLISEPRPSGRRSRTTNQLSLFED